MLALPADLQRVAVSVRDGLIAVLLPDEEVPAARVEFRDMENVIFTPADSDGLIPWRDGFFTVVYAPEHDKATPEMLRVIVRKGVLHLQGQTIERD
jgi:hypothetical protein